MSDSNPIFPSRHHYVLAHDAIRGMCQSNPHAFLDAMKSPEKDAVLKDLWDRVCDHCIHSEQPAFGIEDVTIECREVAGMNAVIVIMPPPEDMSEAHFVGIVPTVNVISMDPAVQPTFEYFVLEKTESCTGSGTMLCKWTHDGRHLNFGPGPKTTVDGFVKAMEETL